MDGTPDLARLHGALLDSRRWFERHAERVACRYADSFGVSAERLLRYWRSLRYNLDDRMQQGLLRYYELAVALDEAAPVGALPWADVTAD